MTSRLFRWLSWLWPIRIQRVTGAHGELEVVWENGRLVVNSTNANQSFGSLHRVWQQCFREIDLVGRTPAQVLVLGFGAGSVGHILHNELGLSCPITGIDDDPAMLRIAQEYFGCSPGPLLTLHLADAFTWVAEHDRTYDLIVIDLFHELDFDQGLLGPGVLGHIRRLASAQGRILINTVVYDDPSAALSARLGAELRLHASAVQESRHEGSNRVFIAL